MMRRVNRTRSDATVRTKYAGIVASDPRDAGVAPTCGSFTDVAIASNSVSVIDADDGVDVTLIRWMLSLSPEERLAVLQGFVDSVVELTHDSPATKVQRSA